MHGIIAGRKRNVLQTIMEETATNIYMPSPLQGLIGPEFGQPSSANPTAPSNKLNSNVIWITGEFFGVQRARDMLYQVSMNKVRFSTFRSIWQLLTGFQSKQVMSKDTAILPRKLDWMVTERAEDLKALMHDNATFIQFPPIGSSTSLITIFGDHRVNIHRTIRAIMQLVSGHLCCRVTASLTFRSLGLPILCSIIVASSGAIQRPSPFCKPQPYAGVNHSQTSLLH